MITLQCALCGKKQNLAELYPATFSTKKINEKTFSARRTPDRMHHRFVKCLNCGLIFSNPILPSKEIEKLYKKSDFDYSLESEYLKKTYGYYLKKVFQNTDKKVALLDIGCGNGFFLEEAKDMGVDKVSGVEPGKASVKKAPKWLQKNIKIDVLKNGLFPKNTFDIICCFHTLDHIIDPNAFIKIVHNLLKKGGYILFIVHNTDGLSVKMFGEKSPIFDIEHIYLFNKKSLSQLFEKNKFKTIETFDVKNKYPLQYWMRMSPVPAKLKAILLFSLQKTKTANIPIALQAGNIGIVAQKK